MPEVLSHLVSLSGVSCCNECKLTPAFTTKNFCTRFRLPSSSEKNVTGTPCFAAMIARSTRKDVLPVPGLPAMRERPSLGIPPRSASNLSNPVDGALPAQSTGTASMQHSESQSGSSSRRRSDSLFNFPSLTPSPSAASHESIRRSPFDQALPQLDQCPCTCMHHREKDGEKLSH